MRKPETNRSNVNRSHTSAACTCLLAALLTLACSGREAPGDRSGGESPVQSGAERLIDNHLQELRGKRIGLLMNPTSRVDGTHMLDTLLARNIDVTALFASEHGFRGEAGAGEEIIGGGQRHRHTGALPLRGGPPSHA